jgi:hypothetical protein
VGVVVVAGDGEDTPDPLNVSPPDLGIMLTLTPPDCVSAVPPDSW